MEDKLGIVRAILSDPHYWIPALLILLCLFWMGGRLIYVERHKMLVNPIRTEKYGFLPIEENKPVIKSEQENALPKIKVEKKKPSIIQNIESGGAGIQNNAPNYGNQSISVNPEPQLTHVLKKQIIELVGDLVKKHNTDTFGFELVNGSRGGKI